MIFGYQNHILSAWPLLYFLIMADIWNFSDTILISSSKNTFFYFPKWWFVAEIQGLKVNPASASKIKSTNCLAWPHLYFLFTADGWNFCGTFLGPYTKNTFLFFKILSSSWENRKEHPKNVIIGYQKFKLWAWPLLYFLFMADVWNFCDTFLRP